MRWGRCLAMGFDQVANWSLCLQWLACVRKGNSISFLGRVWIVQALQDVAGERSRLCMCYQIMVALAGSVLLGQVYL